MSAVDLNHQPEDDRSADSGAASEIGIVAGDASGGGTVMAQIAADLRPLAWPIDDLRPAPDNARKHADADVDALAESLRTHAQQKSIVAKRQYRGLANVVIAGNGTLAAARCLG